MHDPNASPMPLSVSDARSPVGLARSMAAIPVLFGLLSGCAGLPSTQAASASMPQAPVVTDLRGHRIDVRAGGPFEIRLPSNRSTGYRWTLIDPIPAAVRLDGESLYEQGPHAMPGAPGVEIWRFTGVAPGQGTLHFEYRRPWEPATVPPAQRTRYRVEVR